MKKGDLVRTPRFCKVEISHIFANEANARKRGYTEPTHCKNPEYGILGKSLDVYHMEFAAYKI